MTAITFTKGADVGGPTSALPYVGTSTYNGAGGVATITAAQLVNGYVYNGDGNAVALNLPTATTVLAHLTTRGVAPSIGMSFPPVIIDDTGAGALTVTGGATVNVHGDNTGGVGSEGAITATTAIVFYVLSTITGNGVAEAIVVKAD